MNTALFPFPHVLRGQQRDGSAIPWPPVCLRCKDRPCETARTAEIGLCPYGMNFARVDKDMLIAGVVVGDFQVHSKARQKRYREYRTDVISSEVLQRAIHAYRSLKDDAAKQVLDEKATIIRDYVQREQFKPDFLDPLRGEIAKGLSFVHDYRQINTQIGQNINVVLESRYPDVPLEEKLGRALPAEKAIYEASKFLEEKLSVAKFLLHPDWLFQQDRCTRFRIHGLVTKYARIYASQFKIKDVELSVRGDSFGEIIANPEACAVIPHTLIDNALKYSQKRSKVEVFLKDEGAGVHLSVESFGPRLAPGEEERIFEPFYRGEGAKQFAEEGAGYGLYVSQLVAIEHLGTRIAVDQDPLRSDWRGVYTSFSLTFPPKARILIG